MFVLPECIVALLMVGITSSLIVDLLEMLLREQEPAPARSPANGYESYTRLYNIFSEQGCLHHAPHGNVCIVVDHPVVIPAKIAAYVAKNDRLMMQSLDNASLAAVPSADKDWYDVVADPTVTPYTPQGFEASVVLYSQAGAPWTSVEPVDSATPVRTKTARIHIPLVLSAADLQLHVVRAAMLDAALVATKSDVDGYFLAARL